MSAARSLPEWAGATPDTAVPPRVRLRVFERCDGKCHRCTKKIAAGERWTLEHLKALILGGENREKNLGVTCDWCLPEKNAEDLAQKSKEYEVRAKHNGVRSKQARPMPGSRASGWKHRLGKTGKDAWERRT